MPKIIATNRRGKFDYEILDTFEAGLLLTGPEIKGIRAGEVQLQGSYARPLGDELFWIGGHIKVATGDSQRSRKLLLHREEINELIGKLQEKRLTLIPLSLYLSKGRAKLELGLAHHRKKADKRELVRKRELDRKLKRIQPQGAF
jgi:SsrA-binding protein